jgi:GntR family transcriptional regulator/MocR family aminotransferase
VIDLSIELSPPPGPIHRRLAAGLRKALQSGQLRCGDKLPSTRRLAEQLGIHRHTVMQSLDDLQSEGWIESLPGWGYRVSAEISPAINPWVPKRSEHRWGLAEVPVSQRSLTVASKDYRYSFPSGQPDLRRFPAEEYYSHVREALRRCPADDLLGYAEPEGRQFFREQLQHYLRRARGLEFHPDQVVITHGCQEAVFLIAQLLLKPGDKVAIESMAFANIRQALEFSGGQLRPVALTPDGIDVVQLEQLFRSEAIRLLYLTPLHQYPTTVTLSASKRKAVYELCSRYQVAILEDDYDFEFHYRSLPMPPMKANDPDQRILYCSTFSKVLHPSARLGFAIVPLEVAREMKRLKRIISRQNDNLSQEAVAGWMAEGGFERHLRRMLRLYQQRRTCMIAQLQQSPVKLEYRVPDGGMCVWVDTGVDANKVAARAAKLDLFLTPGSEYRIEPGPSQHFRLGFAYPQPEEIEEGMSRFFQALQLAQGLA